MGAPSWLLGDSGTGKAAITVSLCRSRTSMAVRSHAGRSRPAAGGAGVLDVHPIIRTIRNWLVEQQVTLMLMEGTFGHVLT